MILLYNILSTLLNVYFYALLIYIFMSWIPGARESAIGDILTRICEPFLEPFRRFIPPIGMIDISSLIAIFTLRFASQGLTIVFQTLIQRF